jgi:hypothetical protein
LNDVKLLGHEIKMEEVRDSQNKKSWMFNIGGVQYQMANPQRPIREAVAKAARTADSPIRRTVPDDEEGILDFLTQIKSIMDKFPTAPYNQIKTETKVRGSKVGVDGKPMMAFTPVTSKTFKKWKDIIEGTGTEIKTAPPATAATGIFLEFEKFYETDPDVKRWRENWLETRAGTPKKEAAQSPKILFKFLKEDIKDSPEGFLQKEMPLEDRLPFIIDQLRPFMHQKKGEVFITPKDEEKNYEGEGTLYGAEYEKILENTPKKQVEKREKLQNTINLFKTGKLNFQKKGKQILDVNEYNDKNETELLPIRRTAWYRYAKAIRGFLGANGISVQDQEKDSPLSQSVKQFSGSYATIKLEDKAMLEMLRLLEEESQKSGEAGKIGKDALMMFRIGRGMGLRAEELFTLNMIPFETTDKQALILIQKQYQVSGLRFNSELTSPRFKEGCYEIRAMTSKTKWIGKFTSTQAVADPELDKMIREKKAKMDKSKKGDVYHPVETLAKHSNKTPLKFAAMIGENDFYIDSRTVFSTKPKVTTEQKKHRDALYDLLKKTYKDAGAESTYFQEHPVHALRHIMAQYWLFKTGYDYDFVAKRGHWNTIEVLKDSYGGIDDRIMHRKLVNYQNIADGESADKRLLTAVAGEEGEKTVNNPKAFEFQDKTSLQDIETMFDSDPEEAMRRIEENPQVKESTKIKNFIKKYNLQKEDEAALKEEGIDINEELTDQDKEEELEEVTVQTETDE